MLKTYAVGLLGGLVLALAVAGVYLATEPEQEAGLLWGGIVYDSKQEFNGYLKSKGLSYEVWLQRNPGVAPWDRDVQASSEPSTRPSSPRMPLAVIGLMLATGFALLLVVRHVRPVLARVPAGIGALPSRRPRGDRLGKRLAVPASLRQLGVLASSAVRDFEAAVPRFPGRPGRGRAPKGWLLSGFRREWDIRLGELAFGALAGIAAAMLGVFVVVLFTA